MTMGADNAEKRDGEARRDGATWARHEGDSKFHAVAADNHAGSTLTHCAGRWPTHHEVEREAHPPAKDKCGMCVAMVELRGVEA